MCVCMCACVCVYNGYIINSASYIISIEINNNVVVNVFMNSKIYNSSPPYNYTS